MKFLDSMNFWKGLWTVYIVVLVTFIPWDVIAVIRGHHDKVGDKFTFTHYLVVTFGVSAIGAFIGYLVAHFLIIHRNG